MSEVTTRARAWAISRRDGFTLGFTDHDGPLSFDGITFTPDHGLSARAVVQASGLSVDNSEAEGALSDDGITETDLLAGRWDGAELRMWEVDWRKPSQRVLRFRGTLGEVARNNGAFRAELRGLTEPLGRVGGRVFHPRCSAVLGDAACKVNLDDPRYLTGAIVAEVTDGRVFRIAGADGYDARWFEGGTLSVTSGSAQGATAKVKIDRRLESGARHIEVWAALAVSPSPDDRVELRAGCDKAGATCGEKFRNFLNFRGFPHLPPEDWLISPQNGQRRSDRVGHAGD